MDAVTDDKSLRSRERKRLQVVHAPDLEPDAKLIKIHRCGNRAALAAH